jgi:SAM-dependent methyltransferase
MTATTTIDIDRPASDAFAERLLGILNGSALALAISVGHRTGLFDSLADLPPSTSTDIARAAGLQERYVREWLGTMVTGGIVTYDAERQRYALPPEHAALLTRRAAPNNLASAMQWAAVLGAVEDRIVECFRHGGGVHYHDFPRFHDVMAEESAQTVVAALVETILPLAPGLVEKLERGIDVLDVGCGRGRALMRLAHAFPRSRFRGYEFSTEAVAAAREEAASEWLQNVEFDVVDLQRLDEVERYDLITAFDIVHDQAAPDIVLRNIRRALRPDGLFLMQDIATESRLEDNVGHPVGPFLYTISFTHCMSVSLGQGGAGLGTCWGRQLAEQMLAEAGFSQVVVHQLPHDIMNFWYVVTP